MTDASSRGGRSEMVYILAWRWSRLIVEVGELWSGFQRRISDSLLDSEKMMRLKVQMKERAACIAAAGVAASLADSLRATQ